MQIVNNNMVGALRVVSVEKGYDPERFALVAFGVPDHFTPDHWRSFWAHRPFLFHRILAS